MYGQYRRVSKPFLLVGVLSAILVGPAQPSAVLAQEADTPVPIVNVGGAVQADVFTGQATMSIPIEVLPGRKGLQPNLALVYGSANGNGWVGMGWKLEKGVIERNLKFGVDYDADDYVFRLNGVNVELVPDPNETDQYRAKIEGGFTRIEKFTAPDGQPYFVATDKLGTRYTFGKTARVAAPPPNEVRIFRWCLERVEDTNGNYMELTYESPEDTNQSYLKEIKYTGNEGQEPATSVEFLLEDEDRPDAPTLYTTHFPITTTKRLKTILVKAPGGQVMRSYKLEYYETPSSSGRSLLQSVEQCGRPRENGDEDCLPAQMFDYTKPTGLTFSESLDSLPLEGTDCTGAGCQEGRTRVPQGAIGPSDVDGNGRVELLAYMHVPPTSEDPPDPDSNNQQPYPNTNCVIDVETPLDHGALCSWMYNPTPIEPETELDWEPFVQHATTASVVGTPDYRLAEGPTAFADITGNGATEMYQWDSDGGIDLHIPQFDEDRRALAGWVSQEQVVDWEGYTAQTDPQTLVYRVGFADVDGDGQADFWGRPGQGTTVTVQLAEDYDPENPPQGFGDPLSLDWPEMGPLGSPMGFTDVSGDGRADFWGWRANGDIEVRLSKGDGTFEAPKVLPWVNDSDRQHPIGFADINGDGLADFWGWALVSGGTYTAGHLYYAFAQGDGSFTSPSQELEWDTAFVEPGRVGFADLNGDGKADFYGWKAGEANITYHLTQANGILHPTPQTFEWLDSVASAGPIGFADITGDGLAEFYGWTNAGWNGQVQMLGASEAKPDLLTQVQNGIGGTWTLTYTTTADPAHSAEHTQLPFALTVVDTVTVNDGNEEVGDGNGNEGKTTYALTGGYYHLAERDFRGFHYTTMTGPAGFNGDRLVTETWFHQGDDIDLDHDNHEVNPQVADGYLKGAPYRQEVKEGTTLYSRIDTIYTHDADDKAPFFTPPLRQVKQRCENDGSCRSTRIDWEYDEYGNVERELHRGVANVAGDERTIVRTFEPNVSDWIVGLPSSETLIEGLFSGPQVAHTDFEYDGGSLTRGNLTREVRANDQGPNAETLWTYDALGNVQSIMDAGNSTTTYTYDVLYQTFVVTVTNHKGHRTHTAYYGVNGVPMDDGLYGQVQAVTDPNNAVTRTTYDPFGRVERVTHPDLRFTETDYLYFGREPQRQHIETYWEVREAPEDVAYPPPTYGILAQQYFDGLGRVITDEQPGTVVTHDRITDIEYDARGHVISRSLPHFRVDLTPSTPFPVITYQTDPLGRVTLTTYPDGRVERTCYGLGETGYDVGVTATVDANGHKTRTVRDAYGQVVTVQEYDGDYSSNCSTEVESPYATTQYTYDALGNLKTVKDDAENLTTMVYDSLSRKISMNDPDMGVWTYEYDGVGNLTKQTDAENQVLYFQYDQLHRRVQKDYGTQNDPGQGNVVWSYDEGPADRHGIGRLTTISQNAATIPSATELSYDARGRVTKQVDKIGVQPFTTEMTYDGINRETTRTYPDGSTVQNDYFGQYLMSVSEAGGPTYATFGGLPTNPLAYTPLGQPTSITTGDKVSTAYTYEPNNFRLKRLKTTRCDHITCTPDIGDIPFDPLDPLALTFLQNLTYAYDQGGNVKSITGSPHGDQSFLYDALDRLTKATVAGTGERTYTYNAIGNMLSHSGVGDYTYPPSSSTSVHPHAVTTAGPYTYAYDANGNMLTGADRTIEYDADNRPISITSTGYGEPPSAPTITDQPDSRTVAEGQSATFIVSATGTTPLSYQWRRNGADLAGETGASYTLSNTRTTDSGDVFTVRVSNPAGDVTSVGATLTVLATYYLTLTMEGTVDGTVTQEPDDWTCNTSCPVLYLQDTVVTLTATPEPGVTFRGWSGSGCSGTAPCVVTMDQAHQVTATFGRLLAYWPLDGNATDASQNGNDGTLVSSPTPVPGVDGQVDGALLFNGTNQQRIDLPNDLTENQAEVTMAFWVNPEEWGGSKVLYSEVNIQLEEEYVIQTDKWITRDTSGPTEENDLALPNLSDQEGWQHLAFVYSVSHNGGQGLKAVYLNGGLVASTSDSIDRLTNERFQSTIGGTFLPATSFDGAIDEVRLYDHALTPGEIATLAGTPPPTQTLTVTVNGEGTVSSQVNGTPDGGINCSPTCNANYEDGTIVTLVASPAQGSIFTGWDVCPGTGTCQVEMAQANAVKATFEPIPGLDALPAILMLLLSDDPPTITTQPGSVTVTEPASASFSVVATGDAPLTYEWKRNGVNISGETSATYNLTATDADLDNGAQFTVVVTNGGGSVTSATATLTVNSSGASLERPAPSALFALASWEGGSAPTETPALAGSSPYLQFAAFRSPATTLPHGLDHVAEVQEAQQKRLDEFLVRTQASPPGGTVTTFVYDGEGNRVVKQVGDWVTVYIGQHYVCHGTPTAIQNGDDLSCARLIWANGQRIAMVQVDNPTSVTYFHADHLGSSTVITDENGAVEQDLAYWAFGETRVNAPSDPGNPTDIAYKYTGQELDGTTGLYDYHARLYDPVIGRFISPDPIVPEPFNPQAFNRYSYVVNNPLKYIDPTGHAKVELIGDDLDIGRCGLADCGSSSAFNNQLMGPPGPQLLASNDLQGTGGKSGSGRTNDGVSGSQIEPPDPTPWDLIGIFKEIPQLIGAVGSKIWKLFSKQASKEANELKKATDLAVDAAKVPNRAIDSLQTIRKTGAPPQGYKGGRIWENDGRKGSQVLPRTDQGGNPITYREYDINPHQPGVGRGVERIVIGSDGRAYYTPDHYRTFNEIP